MNDKRTGQRFAYEEVEAVNRVPRFRTIAPWVVCSIVSGVTVAVCAWWALWYQPRVGYSIFPRPWELYEDREVLRTSLYRAAAERTATNRWAIVALSSGEATEFDIVALREKPLFAAGAAPYGTFPREVVLSPDGTTLAFLAGPEVCVAAFPTGFVRRIRLPSLVLSGVRTLSWSADSVRLALMGPRLVCSVTAAGDEDPKIVELPDGEMNPEDIPPTWVDNRSLLVTLRGNILSVDIESGAIGAVCPGRWPVLLKNRRVLLERQEGHFLIHDLLTHEETPAFEDRCVVGEPVVSPDRDFIAYITVAAIPFSPKVSKLGPRIAIRSTQTW